MNALEKKYLDDTISPKELEELKRQEILEADSSKESRMADAWLDGGFKIVKCDAGLRRTKVLVDRATGRIRRPAIKLSTIVSAAACLAIIALSASLFFLSKEKRATDSNEILICTDSGEKANVTLPDGTVVKLNEESSITYVGSLFNLKKRQIEFDGEGYFDVAKCPEKPFIIGSEAVEVTVTGTRFLFLSNMEKRQIELVLDEGSVSMKTLSGESQVELNAGQKASLDFTTNTIMVTEAVQKGEKAFANTSVSFINTSLEDVIRELSELYHTTVVIKSLPDGCYFTGHLLTANMTESLDVLSRIYHLSVIVEDGAIIISKK